MKMKAGNKTVEITHEDKILFPKSKITKADLAKYYLSVAPFMLPLIKDRPISMMRQPQGIQEEGFFQKNAPEGRPDWIKTVTVKREEKENMQMILCNDAATLLWLVNQNCITPHIWLSRYDQPKTPDRMIFDLDPPTKKEFKTVVDGAQILHEFLEKELKLNSFVNTTGSRGLHVVVPLKRDLEFERVRAIAKQIASHLVEEYPEKFTIEVRKNKRKGKIYIDTIRNAYGQTVVAPYSVRAIEKAPVAVPLFWKELDRLNDAQKFHIHNIEPRLKKSANPWVKIDSSANSLKKLKI